MAVNPAESPPTGQPPTSGRPVPVRQFVRLKLRVLGNGLRGKPVRVLMFVAGIFAGLYLAGVGFLLLAISTTGDAEIRLIVASLGGAVLVFGSVLLPMVWFGMDDTLDPTRFALLPIRRHRLIPGLFAAALVSVPAVALLLATTGLLIPAAVHGGPGAAAIQAVGLVIGALLCVAASRAVTSAFAAMLRSRQMRDLAWVLLAAAVALLAPLQLAITSATRQADWSRFATAAEVVGWTPLGATYTVGIEVAAGRPLAALAKLLIGAAAVLALLWWWSRTLESAMVGGAQATRARPSRVAHATPLTQLFPRLLPGLPVTPFGAMVAREVRYWWRDAKRRANLIMIAVIGILLPMFITASGGWLVVTVDGEQPAPTALSPAATYVIALLVGAFAASVLANQFGFDGSAYANHLTVGVPGRVELGARALAHAILLVPLLIAISVPLAIIQSGLAIAPALLGLLLAGYGAGLAINTTLSIMAAYALPETSNPFATASGAGLGKSLLALVAILASALVTLPVLIAAWLLGDGWSWLALPMGAGYGLALAVMGCRWSGRLLDRRAPQLLIAVTPRS